MNLINKSGEIIGWLEENQIDKYNDYFNAITFINFGQAIKIPYYNKVRAESIINMNSKNNTARENPRERYAIGKYTGPYITSIAYEIGRIIAECKCDAQPRFRIITTIWQIRNEEDWPKIFIQYQLEKKWHILTYIENLDREPTCREEITEFNIKPKNESWKQMMSQLRNEIIINLENSEEPPIIVEVTENED
jgi:hypothetical protein